MNYTCRLIYIACDVPLVLFEQIITQQDKSDLCVSPVGFVYVEVIISFVPGMGSLSAMENKGGAQRYFR